MSSGTTRMGPVSRVDIDLARRPDCLLIAFVDDVAELVIAVPMTAAPPGLGERRLLHLVLPSGGEVTGMSEVRYHRTDATGGVTGCGLSFVAMGPPQREALDAFVRATTAPSRLLAAPPTRRGDEPQRSHSRVPAQIDVQIERPRRSLAPAEIEVAESEIEELRELSADVTFESEHNFYTGFSENVGDGGLFIQSWAAHDVGDRLMLRVTLPDSEVPLDIFGEVRWMRPYNRSEDIPPGIGVAFVDLGDDVKQRIDAFVKQRRPLFFDD